MSVRADSGPEVPRRRAPACTLVLVHSPLVGALTWRATADRLEDLGCSAVVVDLQGANDGESITARVVSGTADTPRPTVLVGHSGAGRYLPALADAVPGTELLVYVDAMLPEPGRSWLDDAPPELTARLRELAGADGVLPPWSDWFGPDALAEILPDPVMRERLRDESPRLPLDFFAEPAPLSVWSGPQVYVRLSDAYLAEAERMAAAGVPVLVRPSHHLAMLTDPAMVAEALLTSLVV